MSESVMTKIIGTASGILKPLGLYKVNDVYLAPVNEKLSASAEEADAVKQDVHECGKIVEAINAGDNDEAVGLVLEYFEIDDEVAEHNDICSRVESGEVLSAAVSAKDSPALIEEMVRSTRSCLEEAITMTDQLLQTLVETSDLAMRKVKELPAVALGDGPSPSGWERRKPYRTRRKRPKRPRNTAASSRRNWKA